jgi:aryl-alcohol dehydrogenase-like predicted oxidoreductase
LGKAIKQLKIPRDEIVVLTKVYFPTDSKHQEYNALARNSHEAWVEDGYANRFGLSRKHIFESVKASLARLQLEYVDVLQCHRWDPDTPFEETMQALHDVVQAGYVRYIGMVRCSSLRLQH